MFALVRNMVERPLVFAGVAEQLHTTPQMPSFPADPMRKTAAAFVFSIAEKIERISLIDPRFVFLRVIKPVFVQDSVAETGPGQTVQITYRAVLKGPKHLIYIQTAGNNIHILLGHGTATAASSEVKHLQLLTTLKPQKLADRVAWMCQNKSVDDPVVFARFCRHLLESLLDESIAQSKNATQEMSTVRRQERASLPKNDSILNRRPTSTTSPKDHVTYYGPPESASPESQAKTASHPVKGPFAQHAKQKLSVDWSIANNPSTSQQVPAAAPNAVQTAAPQPCATHGVVQTSAVNTLVMRSTKTAIIPPAPPKADTSSMGSAPAGSFAPVLDVAPAQVTKQASLPSNEHLMVPAEQPISLQAIAKPVLCAEQHSTSLTPSTAQLVPSNASLAPSTAPLTPSTAPLAQSNAPLAQSDAPLAQSNAPLAPSNEQLGNPQFSETQRKACMICLLNNIDNRFERYVTHFVDEAKDAFGVRQFDRVSKLCAMAAAAQSIKHATTELASIAGIKITEDSHSCGCVLAFRRNEQPLPEVTALLELEIQSTINKCIEDGTNALNERDFQTAEKSRERAALLASLSERVVLAIRHYRSCC